MNNSPSKNIYIYETNKILRWRVTYTNTDMRLFKIQALVASRKYDFV